jgi:hypothetical protein
MAPYLKSAAQVKRSVVLLILTGFRSSVGVTGFQGGLTSVVM